MGHNIVPSGAGWATFGWLTGVFVLGTIIFALSLQVIIARLRRVEKIFDRLIAREGGRAPPKTEFIVEERSSLQALQNAFGMRKRRGKGKIEVKDEEDVV